MKRLVMGTLVCLAVVAMCSTSAMAQRRGGGRRGGGGFGFGGFGGGGMNPTMMLSFGNEQLQKELKIDDEQKEKIKTIAEEARSAGGGFRDFRDLSEEERNKRFEEMRKRGEETNKKIEGLLKPEQLARLRGIYLQIGGTAALTDPEIAKELKLSDDTVKQIKTISEEIGKKRREIRGKMRDASDEERTKLREESEKLGKEATEESLAQLSPEQKAQVEKMKGDKFELDRSAWGRGGGGGRRRNRDNDTKNEDKKT